MMTVRVFPKLIGYYCFDLLNSLQKYNLLSWNCISLKTIFRFSKKPLSLMMHCLSLSQAVTSGFHVKVIVELLIIRTREITTVRQQQYGCRYNNTNNNVMLSIKETTTWPGRSL